MEKMNPRMKQKWFNELGEYLAMFGIMLIPLLVAIGLYIDSSQVSSIDYMVIGIMSFLFFIFTIIVITIYIHDMYVLLYNRMLEWVINVSNDVSINNDINISNEIYTYIDRKVKKCKQ